MVKSLILVEGEDDIKFIHILLTYLKVDKKYIVVKKLNDKSNFFKIETYENNNILASLKEEEYNKILFIFDSDYKKDNKKYGGYTNSEKEIKTIIAEIKKEIGFEFYTDYNIMCDPITKNGNLEHLILSTLDDTQKGCIEDLLNCIKPYETDSNKKIVLSGYTTIFKEPLYNFEHKNFDELKDKIKKLVED